MTVNTAGFIHHGPMHPFLAECLIDHIVMTSLAKFVTGLLHSEGFCRRRFIVTLVAHLVLNRFMDIVSKDCSGI